MLPSLTFSKYKTKSGVETEQCEVPFPYPNLLPF